MANGYTIITKKNFDKYIYTTATNMMVWMLAEGFIDIDEIEYGVQKKVKDGFREYNDIYYMLDKKRFDEVFKTWQMARRGEVTIGTSNLMEMFGLFKVLKDDTKAFREKYNIRNIK